MVEHAASWTGGVVGRNDDLFSPYIVRCVRSTTAVQLERCLSISQMYSVAAAHPHFQSRRRCDYGIAAIFTASAVNHTAAIPYRTPHVGHVPQPPLAQHTTQQCVANRRVSVVITTPRFHPLHKTRVMKRRSRGHSLIVVLLPPTTSPHTTEVSIPDPDIECCGRVERCMCQGMCISWKMLGNRIVRSRCNCPSSASEKNSSRCSSQPGTWYLRANTGSTISVSSPSGIKAESFKISC